MTSNKYHCGECGSETAAAAASLGYVPSIFGHWSLETVNFKKVKGDRREESGEC